MGDYPGKPPKENVEPSSGMIKVWEKANWRDPDCPDCEEHGDECPEHGIADKDTHFRDNAKCQQAYDDLVAKTKGNDSDSDEDTGAGATDGFGFASVAEDKDEIAELFELVSHLIIKKLIPAVEKKGELVK